MRILTWDIETAGFSNYKGPAADWGYIVSISYKWLHELKPRVLTIADFLRFKKNPHDDKDLLKAFYKIIQQADVLVHHYGNVFDKPFLLTRNIIQKIGPLPKVRHFDTCKVAQTLLKLSSNKLSNVCEKLGLPYLKLKSKFPEWWFGALKGDRKAIKALAKYNIGDVLATEQVYLALRPYTPDGQNTPSTCTSSGCPRCDSGDIVKRGVVRLATGAYQRFKCKNPNCGAWSRNNVRLGNVKIENEDIR